MENKTNHHHMKTMMKLQNENKRILVEVGSQEMVEIIK